MSTYADDWSNAKKAYETSTGKKKPSDSDGKWYEKVRTKSGVSGSLKAVDKLMPESLLTVLPEKEIKKIRGLLDDASKAADKYVVLVQTAVEKEKALGKDKSDIYRDLKVLRSKLDTIITSIELDLAKLKASASAVVDKVDASKKLTYMTIKTLGASLDRNAKQALTFAQEMMKDPTPQNYNDNIQKAARDFTQSFSNIVKWAIPDELNPTHAANRMVAMQDPGVYKAVHSLYGVVYAFKEDIKDIAKLSGSTPLDASLSKLATGSVRFPLTATSAEVVAGVKHLIAEVKTALKVREKLKL